MTGHLHAALDRAQNRLKIARRNLADGRGYLNPNDPAQARTLRKLQSDVTSAERDVAYAQNILDRELAELGLTL